jgi:hypothetical protein
VTKITEKTTVIDVVEPSNADTKPDQESKQKIVERLVDKYLAKMKIKKEEFDDNQDYDSDDMIYIECGIHDYEGGKYGIHPVEFESNQTEGYLCRGLPALELPAVKGTCYCPLSLERKKWRKSKQISDEIEDTCKVGKFNNCKSMLDHLKRGGMPTNTHTII